MDLFAQQREDHRQAAAPLAARMRPRTLDEFVGQGHVLGPGKPLRRLLEAGRLTSVLFYGPPGTGKTTLAHLVAHHTGAAFGKLHPADAGVKQIREAIADARARLDSTGQRTLLFIDELHRFNRAQQDVLLDDVEQGTVILIGATTENPFFSVNTPLISRSQVFQFTPLAAAEIVTLMQRALADEERGLGAWRVSVEPAVLDNLARLADGDARRALQALEVAVLSQASESNHEQLVVITPEVAAESIQRKVQAFDAHGDQHYDTISALIKSIRASHPDAAIYWLARLLEGGEDPRFIARRIVIAAAEDVGNADPQGLILAQAAADATSFIGLPECELVLAQAVTYLACALKSNAAAQAIWDARRDVRERPTIPVPPNLKSAAYPGAEKLGAGAGYRYPHDYPDCIVPNDDLGVDRVYYNPTDRGAEEHLRKHLDRVRAARNHRV